MDPMKEMAAREAKNHFGHLLDRRPDGSGHPSRRRKSLLDVTFSKRPAAQDRRPCRTAFRSSFHDWPQEQTDHPREVIETALAHVVGIATEVACARSDRFERRPHLMQVGAY